MSTPFSCEQLMPSVTNNFGDTSVYEMNAHEYKTLWYAAAADIEKLQQRLLADEALLRQALAALEIGRDYAFETAEQFHIEMRGYKQQRHDAMDADVKQINDTIAALKERLK